MFRNKIISQLVSIGMSLIPNPVNGSVYLYVGLSSSSPAPQDSFLISSFAYFLSSLMMPRVSVYGAIPGGEQVGCWFECFVGRA